MYTASILVLATIVLPNHQNLITLVWRQFNKTTVIPSFWLALAVLGLFVLAEYLNKKDAQDIHFNRLKVTILSLIVVVFVSSICF
ncbi:hypothetical protein [Oenococcus sicerae]|nr:hypothetical protein [Oenococcus sicerae]